jgi:hypothetical protein
MGVHRIHGSLFVSRKIVHGSSTPYRQMYYGGAGLNMAKEAALPSCSVRLLWHSDAKWLHLDYRGPRSQPGRSRSLQEFGGHPNPSVQRADLLRRWCR